MRTHDWIRFGRTMLIFRKMQLDRMWEKHATEGYPKIKVHELAHEKVPRLEAELARSRRVESNLWELANFRKAWIKELLTELEGFKKK